MLGKSLLLGGFAANLVAAQFPPKPKGVITLKSKFHENVTISYKQPHICETTPGVKSYSGHVHLPPGFLNDAQGEPQNYPVNTFFWFFEARKDPENAPLAIWLNGGPGASSMMGLLQENGPCFINPDSSTTTLNPWSWNNEVNMLYIDEPNQVGFSYDVLTNVTISLNATSNEFVTRVANFKDDGSDVPQMNATSRVGTISSQKAASTTNSTAQAAHALWHFAQTWFFEFPAYKPNDDKISLWAESYGGHYGPGFMRFFQQQNEKIKDGSIDVAHAQYIHLDTLGIVNGLLDAVVQEESYITFPYNNTYGVEIFNQTVHDELLTNWTRPHGCKAQLAACQKELKHYDPVSLPVSVSASSPFDSLPKPKVCKNIKPECEAPAVIRYFQSEARGWFDIGHPARDPFPPPHIHGYLMQESVLSALGVPLNFSATSEAVATNFFLARDEVHGGFLDAVGYLLDSGVKVHMMYGDRDYACNWVGGEAASLRIPYARAKDFSKAGYMPLLTTHGFDGMTRQHGNYSFTRVFQSGHMIPSYQPVAAYQVFMRALFNKDIATGLLPVTDEFSTVGLTDTWHIKNTKPPMPKSKCYILDPGTCTEDVWKKVVKGEALVKDYFVVDIEDEPTDGGKDEHKNDDWVIVEKPVEDEQEVIGEL